jgi:hypothetical protein
MNRIFVTVLTAWAMLAGSSAIAGKVNIPKEGSYDFDFCAVGESRALVSGDKIFVSNYRVISDVRTEPAGKPFDRMSALCYGNFVILNGRSQDFGVCELTDVDGDKWWMEFHGNVEGTGGTYTSPYGTGKYEGMTIKGQYVLDAWPVSLKDIFQGCNHNKGTYKLK